MNIERLCFEFRTLRNYVPKNENDTCKIIQYYYHDDKYRTFIWFKKYKNKYRVADAIIYNYKLVQFKKLYKSICVLQE